MIRSVVAALGALMALAGCATANFSTPAATAPGISGAPVFVYSMLDLRQNDFGQAMVTEVNQQLVARLAEHGVQAEVVTFRETPAGMSSSLVGSTYIPIDRIVADNRDAEARLGARYRLIIVPSNITIMSASQDYEINWHLIDTYTNRPVWRTTLRGGRVIWWSQNEDARGRAAGFVDGVINEMSRSGLFAPAGPAPTGPPMHVPAPAPVATNPAK